MAAALISGIVKRGTAEPGDLYVIDPSADTRTRLREERGVATGETIEATLAAYDAIVLAVEPQVLNDVARAIAPHLGQALVVSIAAGIRATDLSRWLGGYTRIVRTMPNMPALVGMGVTGLAALDAVDAVDRELASVMLGAVGETVWFDDEACLDAVTAISGSGPAYVFYFIEALQEAARQLGLNEEQGRALAVATFTGTAQLAAQSSEPVGVLRKRVTSKSGTTVAALTAFEAQQLKDKIVSGVLAADARARELGDELGRA
ncbi:MAG: Pyrroline-5-carboxylate reductase [Burkholderia gladioli]|nr:MAG: Pyrroline-5-carboxylate reductase [Burkholderia gladioli]